MDRERLQPETNGVTGARPSTWSRQRPSRTRRFTATDRAPLRRNRPSVVTTGTAGASMLRPGQLSDTKPTTTMLMSSRSDDLQSERHPAREALLQRLRRSDWINHGTGPTQIWKRKDAGEPSPPSR